MSAADGNRLWRARQPLPVTGDVMTKVARGKHNDRAAREMQEGGNWIAEFSDDDGSFLGCDKNAPFLAGDGASHVQTVCAEGAECFGYAMPIDPHNPNLPTFAIAEPPRLVKI